MPFDNRQLVDQLENASDNMLLTVKGDFEYAVDQIKKELDSLRVALIKIDGELLKRGLKWPA